MGRRASRLGTLQGCQAPSEDKGGGRPELFLLHTSHCEGPGLSFVYCLEANKSLSGRVINARSRKAEPQMGWRSWRKVPSGRRR